MFGSKKSEKRRTEREDEFSEELSNVQEEFEAGRRDIETSSLQMKRDFARIAEYDRQTGEAVVQNLETAAYVIHELNLCMELLQQKEQVYQEFCSRIQEQNRAILELVEENKHFTSPSKYFSEVPAELRKQGQEYISELVRLENSSKEMGVLALNAAIEAGRMGDAGKQFVSAAEEIRATAGTYEASLGNLRMRMNESVAEIDKFEEQVRHMVKLLKENNMATAKLMKQCALLSAKLEKNLLSSAEESVRNIREEVIGIKNANDEILKEQERSRLLVGDITSEFDAQQKILTEMEDAVIPFFVMAEDHIKSNRE